MSASLSLPSWHVETERHMQNLEVGDEFNEMYSFWVRVDEIRHDGSIIASDLKYDKPSTEKPGYWECHWEPRLYESAEAFRTRFRYQPDAPRYWVRYTPPHRRKEKTSP